MNAVKVRRTRRCVCSGWCYTAACADCGEKLSSHDFLEEESRRFAESEPHRCRRKS